jgi:hypothetical protein
MLPSSFRKRRAISFFYPHFDLSKASERSLIAAKEVCLLKKELLWSGLIAIFGRLCLKSGTSSASLFRDFGSLIENQIVILVALFATQKDETGPFCLADKARLFERKNRFRAGGIGDKASRFLWDRTPLCRNE